MIKIDREQCRDDGFTEKESDWIEAYCNNKAENKTYSNQPALISFSGNAKDGVFVTKTIAEAIDKLRPGAWLRTETQMFLNSPLTVNALKNLAEAKPEIDILCSCCLCHDPGVEHTDPEIRNRANKLDFVSSGPCLSLCDLCDKPFQQWDVPREQWELLPECYHDYSLCQDDFLDLVRETGHDSGCINITHESWTTRLDRWNHANNNVSKQHTHIRFHGRETMWCVAVECKCDGRYVVRLDNSSVIDDSLTEGTYFLAKWNGSLRHMSTGRPILTPISRIMPPGKHRKTRTKASQNAKR